jgi:hypothetical protein
MVSPSCSAGLSRRSANGLCGAIHLLTVGRCGVLSCVTRPSAPIYLLVALSPAVAAVGMPTDVSAGNVQAKASTAKLKVV